MNQNYNHFLILVKAPNSILHEIENKMLITEAVPMFN